MVDGDLEEALACAGEVSQGRGRVQSAEASPLQEGLEWLWDFLDRVMQ